MACCTAKSTQQYEIKSLSERKLTVGAEVSLWPEETFLSKDESQVNKKMIWFQKFHDSESFKKLPEDFQNFLLYDARLKDWNEVVKLWWLNLEQGKEMLQVSFYDVTGTRSDAKASHLSVKKSNQNVGIKAQKSVERSLSRSSSSSAAMPQNKNSDRTNKKVSLSWPAGDLFDPGLRPQSRNLLQLQSHRVRLVLPQIRLRKLGAGKLDRFA